MPYLAAFIRHSEALCLQTCSCRLFLGIEWIVLIDWKDVSNCCMIVWLPVVRWDHKMLLTVDTDVTTTLLSSLSLYDIHPVWRDLTFITWEKCWKPILFFKIFVFATCYPKYCVLTFNIISFSLHFCFLFMNISSEHQSLVRFSRWLTKYEKIVINFLNSTDIKSCNLVFLSSDA